MVHGRGYIQLVEWECRAWYGYLSTGDANLCPKSYQIEIWAGAGDGRLVSILEGGYNLSGLASDVTALWMSCLKIKRDPTEYTEKNRKGDELFKN